MKKNIFIIVIGLIVGGSMQANNDQDSLINRIKAAFGYGKEVEIAKPPLEYLKYQFKEPNNPKPLIDNSTPGSLEAEISFPYKTVRYTSANYRSQGMSRHGLDWKLTTSPDELKKALAQREATPVEEEAINEHIKALPLIVKGSQAAYDEGWIAREKFEENINKQKFRREGTENTLLTIVGAAALAGLVYGGFWAYNRFTTRTTEHIMKKLKKIDTELEKNIKNHGYKITEPDNKKRLTEDETNYLISIRTTIKVAMDKIEPATR